METIEAIFVILFFNFGTAILTAIGCWLSIRYHRRPGWYLAFLGTLLGVGTLVLYPDGGFVLHPDQFEHSKSSPADEFESFLITSAVGLIPSLLVVWYYRDKYRAMLKPLHDKTQ